VIKPRDRRLCADRREVGELAEQLEHLSFICEGDPPDRYLFSFTAEGLGPSSDGGVDRRTEHQVACYLHLDYPRHAPLLVWQTPIFHPNILGPDRHGAVCLGSWSASESLADLCRRLIDLATWRSFSLTDALNADAGRWAAERGMRPGSRVEEALADA